MDPGLIARARAVEIGQDAEWKIPGVLQGADEELLSHLGIDLGRVRRGSILTIGVVLGRTGYNLKDIAGMAIFRIPDEHGHRVG